MSYWRPKGLPADVYEGYRWQEGCGGLYESNYIKANSPDGQRALWIKHNLLSFAGERKEAVAELWCALFEKGKAPRCVKQEIPVSRVTLGKEALRMEGKEILLSEARTATTIRDGKDEVSWEIGMERIPGLVGEPLIHFPHEGMYRWPFPKKKILTPAPKTRWNGRLRWNEEEILIEGWLGFRGHNWGTEHAWQYAYGNCNDFEGDPDFVVDAFSAKIRLGPLLSPFLSAAIVRGAEGDRPFNSIKSILFAKTLVAFPRWEVRLETSTHRLEWLQEGRPDEFIGLCYVHPDGKKSFCYNTKWAKTRVVLQEKKGQTTERRSEQGELEFLFAEPLAGIPVIGERK